MQLLKPLAIFEREYDAQLWQWHTYLSPTVRYFHGRHILYGIIAILCELIFGIGPPLVILTQRYLIRYFNLRLIAIKPVIDQLQGCYKEEYRWFAAYYLICRQVIYITDIFSDFLTGIPSDYTYGAIQISNVITVSSLFCIFIAMMLIHVWLRPYKLKGLNILDGSILLVLLFLLISGSYGGLCDDSITVVLFILPLILLLNYLALNSRLKHILIPVSCVGIFVAEVFVTMQGYFDLAEFFEITLFGGIFHILIIITPLICLMAYIIWVVKSLCTRHNRREYMLVNTQDNHDVEDSDST